MSPDTRYRYVRAGVAASALCAATFGAVLLFAPEEVSGVLSPGRGGSPLMPLLGAARHQLSQAKSIAYSASVSGLYVSTELFQRLGIADQVLGKSQRVDRERVGAVVAHGEAEIGFQQISELLPVPGIDYVGPLPAEVQKVTVSRPALRQGRRMPMLPAHSSNFWRHRKRPAPLQRVG